MSRRNMLDGHYKDDPFVGREKELALLHDNLERAYDYQGRFVLIQGDAGIGKTKLVNEFIRTLDPQGPRVLIGRSLKDDARPYGTFLQMVEDFLENVEHRSSWLVKLVEPDISPCFFKLFPKFRDNYPLEMPALGQAADKTTCLYAFDRFFENLSRYRPLVLFLDDCLWMNEESKDLLKYIVLRNADRPILMLGTTRPFHDNTTFQKTVDEMTGNQMLYLLNLKNLTLEDTKNIVYREFGHSIAQVFVRWLFRVTRGNPLFIAEILNVLERQNVIRFEERIGDWLVTDDYEDFPITATVESVIKYRLGNLSVSALQVLQTAAVIGEQFKMSLLQPMLPRMSRRKFLGLCNLLKNEKLIQGDDDTLVFCHPLIRELLYQKMDVNTRRKLHRQLGARFKKIKGSDEEIAYHLTRYLTKGEQTAKLCRYLLKAYKKSFDKYNFRLALHYLKVAQRIVETIARMSKEKIQINAKLRHMSWYLGHEAIAMEEAECLGAELEKAGLKADAAINYHLLFNEALVVQDTKKAEEWLDKALSLVRKSDPHYWTLMAERLLLLRRKGSLNEAMAEAKRLEPRIPINKAPMAYYMSITTIHMVSLLKGDLASAHKAVYKCLNFAKEHNLLPYIGNSYMHLGLVEMEMGRLDSAITNINESLKAAEVFMREHYITINLLYLGYCFQYKGEFERAAEILDQALARTEKFKNPRIKASVQLGKACMYLAMNRIREFEDLINSIPAKALALAGRCDLEIMKGRLCYRKNEFQRAADFINRALDNAKKYNLGTRYAQAVTEKGLINIKQGNRQPALDFFAQARKILKDQGFLTTLCFDSIRFGSELAGKEGEAIFCEGLEMLISMRAYARIEYLMKTMKAKGFNRAFRRAREIIGQKKSEMLGLTTFGGMNVKKPGELNPMPEREWESKKAKELLGLLIIFAGAKHVSRERLAAYLWSDLGERGSKANFRMTLMRLNKTLGYDALRQEGEFLSLNKDRIHADAWDFEDYFRRWLHLKQQGKLHLAEELARKSVALYGGDFLPELYNRPVLDKQAALKDQAKELFSWLAARSAERLEWTEALSFAHRLLTLDSCDERAHCFIMEGLLNTGDRTGAIKQFERLKKNLEEELRTTPSQETLKLYKKIVES